MTDTTDNPSTALVPKAKLSMGALAAQIDPDVLEAAVVAHREALYQLGQDTTISEDIRAAIANLVALTSPSKPGLEEMAPVWKVASIYIVQPTSRSEAKPENARPSDLYTSSGQLLERPWSGIPIYFYEENINFPENGKNPVCQAPDGKLGSPFGDCLKCPHLPFGKQNGGRGDQNKTDCQSNIVVVMLAMDLSQVYLVRFGKTSRKAGSVMLNLAGQQTVVWKQSYQLNTEKKTADVGLYYVYKVEPTGKNNIPDVMRLAETLYGLYVAERKRFLANWYARPVRAPMVAAAAEAAFDTEAAEAGLRCNDGIEPTDLNTPVTPVTSTSTPEASLASAKGKGKSTSARMSSKPM